LSDGKIQIYLTRLGKENEMPHKHHISHIEIPASDTRVAADFYKAVFDWNITYWDQLDYTMFSAEGGTGGGFTEVNEDTPVGNVLLYIDTPDIKASVEQIKAHGGTVLKESYLVPGVGYMASFKDPTGNVLVVIQQDPGE
jgi:predicted enzyme related to lactoylglutathione lyase